ncbi:MAG: M20/M25/M40 family metallo-hydrolase [Pseudomonadota bacterium]|nr:M20/M25/M40 family metallo-hydrolase [Pseudomonadota bacterium]
MRTIRALQAAVLAGVFAASAAQSAEPALSPAQSQLLSTISADAMRGHLSFLASDALEGRDTPSRGLDISAEYIASQFRAAGLEPLGDDGYFQTADWRQIVPEREAEKYANAPEALPVRNVVGLLRGSDPELSDTYVIVTAHYDHVGIRGEETDRIFNGANDNGSGTVSVIELARAFAAQEERPKRSIVFMTVFGEEHGLVGSRYYGKHPLVPLADTVANINLEQVGRTDDSEGPQVLAAAVTGADYSEVGDVLRRAGELTGINITKHPVNSDRYFAFSDNQALADVGVPAHTLSVAYAFPDYHGAADTWDKIDYDNMAAIDRTVALAILMIANDPQAPRWNADDPKAAKYLEAARKLHSQEAARSTK